MRMTFNVEDAVARKFLALVPNRKRSGLVSGMLKKLLRAKQDKIALACRKANKDAKVAQAVGEWQGFDEPIDGEWV